MMIVNMSVRANLEITHRVDWKTFVNPRIFQYAQLSPDKRLICIVGDDTVGFIANAESGEGKNDSID